MYFVVDFRICIFKNKSWLTSSLLKNEGQYFDSIEEYISSYALNNGGVDLNWTTSDIGPSNARKFWCEINDINYN